MASLEAECGTLCLHRLQAFKPFLEPFIAPLFDSLTCGQQTTAAAAGEFVGQVRDLLGPNIWGGRLTQEQQAAQISSPHVPPPSGELFDPMRAQPASLLPPLGAGWPKSPSTVKLCGAMQLIPPQRKMALLTYCMYDCLAQSALACKCLAHAARAVCSA